MSKGNVRSGMLVVAIIAALFSLISSSLVAQDGSVTVTILHTQEHHGQVEPAAPFGQPNLGGVSARATLIKDIRADVGADNVLLLDSGDILVGTPLSSVFRGEPDIAAYNLMGYDAMTAGNHEFDFEQKENRLQTLQDFADFPIMAANVGGLEFEPDPGYIILTRGGVDFLIIGIANPVTYEVSSPNPDTTFGDPISTVQGILDAEAGNYDIAIALTHEDTFRDWDLLNQVADLDVVIGGHTFGFNGIVTRNSFGSIDDVPDAVADQDDNLVNPDGVYVRAGGGPLSGRLGSSLGRLDLTVANGDVVTAIATNIVIYPETQDNIDNGVENLIALDAEMEAEMAPFINELGSRLDQVIGSTTEFLDGERANVRSMETNLGNLIADVWRETQGTDIGLQNGGGIRNSIAAGDITLASVLSVQPFGNTVVVLTITGQELLDAMENGVSQVEDGAGRFPQISGMTLTWDAAQPAGSRVVEITVGGAPLDLNRTYSVTTNSFVGAGGDGYDVFLNASSFLDTQFIDADVVSDYIRAAGTVSPQVEGRITRLN